MSDSVKAMFGAILGLIIPGLGHAFIKSKYALHYFAVWVVLLILALLVTFLTFGLCSPAGIVPLSFAIITAVDTYYEANGEPQKRIMKDHIK